jgi:hypothetical protein
MGVGFGLLACTPAHNIGLMCIGASSCASGAASQRLPTNSAIRTSALPSQHGLLPCRLGLRLARSMVDQMIPKDNKMLLVKHME